MIGLDVYTAPTTRVLTVIKKVTGQVCPRVISPEVISPETWVMLPEIFSYVARKKKVKSPKETNTKKIRISDCK